MSPEVKTSPSNVGAVGLIPDWGTKISRALGQKKKKKQKTKQNKTKKHRSDIVTNSIKTKFFLNKKFHN